MQVLTNAGFNIDDKTNDIKETKTARKKQKKETTPDEEKLEQFLSGDIN